MFGLCKYKDMFGKPGEGLHAYRVGDIAIIDVLGTLLAAWFIDSSGVAGTYNYYQIAAALFVLGIILHRAFCVKTTVDKLLFGSDQF